MECEAAELLKSTRIRLSYCLQEEVYKFRKRKEESEKSWQGRGNKEINMKVPFFDIKRQYNEIAEEAERNMLSVARSTQYIGGENVNLFEKELSEYLGASFAVSCGNGTDALRIALKACGIGIGDEVITSPFTFFATAEAIANIGATPVFADISEKTLNLDPDSVRNRITNKTKAILPVHIFGMPADMDALCAIAKENGLFVIEDACQAIGARYHGKSAGVIGDIGCFSFYPTKNLGGFGDGGAVVTDNSELAENCLAFKSHGAGKAGANTYGRLHNARELITLEEQASQNGLYDPYKYYNYLVGDNSRLDALQAAVLRVKLNYLDQWNNRRRAIAKRYEEAFSELPLSLVQRESVGYFSCRHQYAVLAEDKMQFVSYLSENGIGTGAFYPVPLHLQKAFIELGYQEGDLPVAEGVCRRSVCLPVFPELREEEVDYIIEKICLYFAGKKEK